MVSPDDVREAFAVARAAFERHLDADWSGPAAELEWDRRATLDHIGDALAFYAAHLARRAPDYVGFSRDGAPGASVAELLVAVESLAHVLARVAEATPPGVRAYHGSGMADASGFCAMACDEILVHADDILRGFGDTFDPPGDLAGRVLARLFPWAPTDGDPWEALRWANGRTALPGRARLGPDWDWHCAPLEEWDGTQPGGGARP